MLHQIGSGVLGPVFRAHEPGRDRLIAIKAFKLDLLPEDVARLASALRRLAATRPAHPLIVPFVDAGLEGTTPFLASEYALGETLDVAMRHLAPAPLDRALAILTPLAEAVDSAWSAGRGHGALHPRDVFIDPVSRAVRHVTGFGIVPALEEVGAVAPARRPYAAPERAAGQPWDVRADVYAVGAIAHELLTGRRPAGPGEQNGVFSSDLTPEQRVGARRVLACALAADPADRYGSAAELVGALETIARGDEAPVPVRSTESAADAPAPTAPATLFDLLVAAGASDQPDTPGTPDPPHATPSLAAPDVPAPPVAASSETTPPPAIPAAPEPIAPILIGPVPAPDPPAVAVTAPARVRSTGDPAGAVLARDLHRELPAMPEPLVVTRVAWGPMAAVAAVMLVLGVIGGYNFGVRRAPAAESSAPAAAAAARSDTEVAVAPDAAAPPANPTPVTPDPAAEPPPMAPDVRRAVAESGRLTVRSVPSGAMVTIDGRVSGETPLTVRDLPLGVHTLQVARPGHAPRTDRVTLTAASPARTLTFELEAGRRALPTHGSIDIDSRPRGARVTVDGRPMGSTPLRVPELLPGPHVITIELDGYVSAVSRTVVEGGKTSSVRVTLERKAGTSPAPGALPPPGGR